MSGYNSEQLDRLEPSYLTSLGLQQAPFTSAHEEKFLYLDAEREQCNNMLHHLTQYSDLLLIVSGERGVGKTSLLQHFQNSANPEWSLAIVQANAMMDAHQLLASIAQGFGLQVNQQPAEALQDTLYQYLVTIQQNGQVPILLVDDGHELPKDALETLFTLADAETGEDNLLRIILFCEPQIEIMLESAAIQPLRERITHTIEIPAFNEEQTAEYIKHRMAVSGFTGASPFQPKDIKKIFKLSHGLPARINELAHLHLSGEKSITVEPEQLPEEYLRLNFSKQRLAAGIAVITLVLVLLLFQDSINRLFEEPEMTPTTAESEPQPTQEALSQADEHNGEQKTIELDVSPITRDQTEQAPPAAADTGVAAPQTAAPETTLATQADKETTPPEAPVAPVAPVAPPVKAHIRSILPNPITGSRQQQTILINGEGFSKDTRVTVSWSANKKQLSPEQVSYENTNQLSIQITVGSQADNWTVQTDDPVHGQSNLYNFKVTAAPVTGLQTISWINQQNPEHFTLQLLGTYNKASLENFVQQHRLEKNTAFFVSQRHNRNWYTLVHGRFTSKPLAQQAVNQLPADLQKIRPWIRRFADIQSKKGSPKTTTSKTTGDLIEPSKSLPEPPTTPPSLDLTANAAWLWSQNPGHYTLQLLGSHQLGALHAFIKQHQLARQTSFYRTRRNNREWFVLLYGSYPDRKQALAAISQLPAELQRSKPWARRFADIHTELSSQ